VSGCLIADFAKSAIIWDFPRMVVQSGPAWPWVLLLVEQRAIRDSALHGGRSVFFAEECPAMVPSQCHHRLTLT